MSATPADAMEKSDFDHSVRWFIQASRSIVFVLSVAACSGEAADVWGTTSFLVLQANREKPALRLFGRIRSVTVCQL